MVEVFSFYQSKINAILPVRRTRNKPIAVKRTQKPYWKKRGWRKSGDKYNGYYRTKSGSFKGKATVSPAGKTKLYIKNPPKCLEKHDHWPCFVKENNGWYFIHTNNKGNFDLSSGIMEIEQIIKEAFNYEKYITYNFTDR